MTNNNDNINTKNGALNFEAPNNPEHTNNEAINSWHLQADRTAIQYPIIECLQIISAHYGRRTSVISLLSGLPIPKNNYISPNIFIRAAQRADLNAKLTKRSLKSLITAPNLPCILSLNDNQACIIWKSIDEKFIVQFPETSDEKQEICITELSKIYSGYAFFIRPIARSDERAGPAEIDTGRDWFWARLWENKIIYSEVIIAAIMINIFGIASSVFIMNVYDRVVPNAAFDTLYAMTAGILIVFIFDFILKNLRAHFLDYANRKADIKISAMLFEQIMGMKMSTKPSSAGVLASNMKEFETLRDFFTSATMTTLIDLPFVFIFIGVIAIIGGPIAFVPLAAIPLIVGMGFYLQKPLRKIAKESMYESALKNALLFETITGLETIKVQAAEGHTQRNWEELSDKASRTSVKSRQISAFAQNWTILIQQITNVAIVFVGVFMISNSSLTMGGLIACVILSGRIMAPLSQIAGLMTKLNQAQETLDQLDELMKRPVERPKGKNFISKSEIKGNIRFQNVVFKYPGQTIPSLNDVNFTIESKERVGIIGAVGSGKTTIERLLLNLYEPDSGSVQIDGTDVRQINPGDLRRNIGAVQQSPQLFYGSVRDNITMGHETAPDSAIIKAAELSGVLDFLKNSPAGLDTMVGERGESLSGGQRQAIAIARALLYDPPILILDEPTASMDPASENRLRKRLEILCKNKTTILITHKGSMLSMVDKLILIDHGRIVAFGPKDEVIKKLQSREFSNSSRNKNA